MKSSSSCSLTQPLRMTSSARIIARCEAGPPKAVEPIRRYELATSPSVARGSGTGPRSCAPADGALMTDALGGPTGPSRRGARRQPNGTRLAGREKIGSWPTPSRCRKAFWLQ